VLELRACDSEIGSSASTAPTPVDGNVDKIVIGCM
jgi:hypothetical protein